MINESRTEKSVRNMVFSIGGQLCGVVISFICRTVFINTLGAEYLGVNGLFSNILSMLSLAELGVGSAITYSMYKPLAEKDESKIKALMGLYADTYRVIGYIVAVLGISLVPFLEDIIKDNPDIPYLTVIYIMFLTNSVITYFFAHKSAIIVADQNQYITTIYSYSFNLIQNIIQIILLITTESFLLYLAVQIICNLTNNYFLSKRADRIYPFLKNEKKEYLDNKSKKTIYKNIGAMLFHRIGTVVVFSTDNILISIFVGVYWVGLYSNYTMIVGIVNNFLCSIFSSITASIGHLNAIESSDKSYQVFKTALFINFWLYCFCAISLWILLNPFIMMWLGSQYILNSYIVLIIVVNFYVTGMRQTVGIYKNTMGLFWNDRYKPLFESVINLVASVFLVRELGIAGIFIGTLISSITTCFWIEPYILYKHGFKRPVSMYFLKYAMYISIAIATAVVTNLTCSVFNTDTLSSFVGKSIICLIIPNMIFIALFLKTSEFRHISGIASGVVSSGLCLSQIRIGGGIKNIQRLIQEYLRI